MAKKTSKTAIAQKDCPCQSGLSYSQCCGRFLEGSNPDSHPTPETAELLMRSRYTAYVLGNSTYLLDTWHPQYRPEAIELEKSLQHSQQKWIGLNIKHTVRGLPQDNTGEVYFIARYKINGKAARLEEHSQFLKIHKQWFYTTGQFL
jgi:SEC-C motif-containing protein